MVDGAWEVVVAVVPVVAVEEGVVVEGGEEERDSWAVGSESSNKWWIEGSMTGYYSKGMRLCGAEGGAVVSVVCLTRSLQN